LLRTPAGWEITATLDYGNTHLDIIERCRQADRQAQFQLYQLYAKSMYNLCLRLLNSEPDAEDLLQQSFVDVFSKLDSFRQEASIGAWIRRIVVNNCINFLQKRKLTLENLDDQLQQLPETEASSLQLDVDSIHQAIQKLPEGCRVVLCLYLLEGYDHQEIAQILHIAESTSKSQYSRARKMLRELLKGKQLLQ
jgi:RNA polymerase sigma-70 factor (ECF subfamily)